MADLRAADLAFVITGRAAPWCRGIGPPERSATALTGGLPDVALGAVEPTRGERAAVAVARRPSRIRHDRVDGALGDALSAVVARVRIDREQPEKGIGL